MPNPNEPLTVDDRPEDIGAWPGGVAPIQSTPLTSSDERMHVMNESCWCKPTTEYFGGDTHLRHRDESSGEDLASSDPQPRRAGPGAATAAAPTVGRIVVYRSKTGKYSIPAIISATVDTLYRLAVDEGHVSDLTDESHVHLTAFTPGFSGHRNSTTSVEQAAALTARSTPAGGSYQEFDVPYDESGETPGTWSWPRRV